MGGLPGEKNRSLILEDFRNIAANSAGVGIGAAAGAGATPTAVPEPATFGGAFVGEDMIMTSIGV
jgi:hypothetical protein